MTAVFKYFNRIVRNLFLPASVTDDHTHHVLYAGEQPAIHCRFVLLKHRKNAPPCGDASFLQITLYKLLQFRIFAAGIEALKETQCQ